MLKLYHYWRSSCSWRVRWALELKGIKTETVAINLLGDDQRGKVHISRSPMGTVPAIEFVGEAPDRQFLSESTAIIEWLDETYPDPPLFPKDPFMKAKTRQLMQIINSGTQPLQNLSVLKFLTDDQKKRAAWTVHWIDQGLAAYESLSTKYPGPWSMGKDLTMADLYLIPQAYNALRYEMDLKKYPKVAAIYEMALKTEACQKSHPDGFQPAK